MIARNLFGIIFDAYSDEAGHPYRFEVGHCTDLKRATIPI